MTDSNCDKQFDITNGLKLKGASVINLIYAFRKDRFKVGHCNKLLETGITLLLAMSKLQTVNTFRILSALEVESKLQDYPSAEFKFRYYVIFYSSVLNPF